MTHQFRGAFRYLHSIRKSWSKSFSYRERYDIWLLVYWHCKFSQGLTHKRWCKT